MAAIAAMIALNVARADELPRPVGQTAEPAKLTEEVRKLLVEKCLACHGNDPAKLKGDFDLRSQAAAFKGGDSGKASIIPGKPAQSPFYVAVTWHDENFQMPPKESERLTTAQLKIIEEWIEQGATWPDFSAKPVTGGAGRIQFLKSLGASHDWTHRAYDAQKAWAFLPVREVKVPAPTSSPSQAAHPVDAFILDRLAAAKLTPAAAAVRRTLVRRATLDLTGLPPTKEQTDAFVRDERPQAYEQLIDQLLASSYSSLRSNFSLY